jgi:tellurite methyltransferase
MPHVSGSLREQFSDIDIYLFDQLLKGRFDAVTRVLDAGCGGGRNLRFLLTHGFEVFGVDEDPAAVAAVRALAARLAPRLSPTQFEVAPVERLPWPDESMDAVLSSAVLHFARDEAHFNAMLDEMWRVLRPGGLFFARLASTIGLDAPVEWLDGRRARLPDGSERFVVDEAMLLRITEALGGQLLDPLKTTNVQNQRAMTTWCLRKPHVHSSTRHA